MALRGAGRTGTVGRCRRRGGRPTSTTGRCITAWPGLDRATVGLRSGPGLTGCRQHGPLMSGCTCSSTMTMAVPPSWMRSSSPQPLPSKDYRSAGLRIRFDRVPSDGGAAMQTVQSGAGLGVRPVVGVLHPGAMGASLGASLKGRSGQVIWAAEGRSDATAKRAELADLVPVRDVAELVARADVVVSICPPDAAFEVAQQVAGYGRPRIYVDANAIAPGTVDRIGALFGPDRVVDAGVIGP